MYYYYNIQIIYNEKAIEYLDNMI